MGVDVTLFTVTTTPLPLTKLITPSAVISSSSMRAWCWAVHRPVSTPLLLRL